MRFLAGRQLVSFSGHGDFSVHTIFARSRVQFSLATEAWQGSSGWSLPKKSRRIRRMVTPGAV